MYYSGRADNHHSHGVAIKTGKKHLEKDKPKKEKDSMTDEILKLMSTRRTFKDKDKDQHKQVNIVIKKKIREVKQWLEDRYYNKEFDNVRRDQLVEILLKKQLDTRDIRRITSLYYDQRTVVPDETDITNEVQIKRRVRQRCVMSLLFNICPEEIIEKALNEEEIGTLEDLQPILIKLFTASEGKGLILSVKKT
ncbi:hypothetical protein HUJ05_008738 [Dendroctonus ponderosae]|nr:hypothetical protein HUJ05_008738 [Dendroctonus ponderosae]